MRCVCGYPREVHEWPSGHCPLCACGALPAAHAPNCPGKEPGASGKLPTLRRGKFREPDPAPGWIERWRGVLFPATEAEIVDRVEQVTSTEVVRTPQIRARRTLALAEIAPRATPIGTLAADLGWLVVPWYWRAHDGTEASVLVLSRGDLRAVAYWERAPGGNWKTAGARAWRVGHWPRSVGITVLAELIEGMGGIE